jgi:RHS repeat-associated protein
VTTLHDESGHWIGDYDVNGQPIQQAIWMDDLPVGLLVGAGANQKLYYIEADALGTPRVVIDPDRNVAVWRWDLAGEAFGNNTPNEDPDGDGTAFVFDMRFPGQRYDSATGMNYNYFRDYDPSMGRYTQSDPIGLAGGISTYGYVGGNPLTRTDAFGLRPGDCYKSPQIAAANAISDINPTSIKENKEYAGWVYKTSNGWYSYTTPRVGTNRLSSAGPRPTGAIGGYHTHGAWDPAFVMNGVDGNEVFSYSPYGNDLNIPVGDWAFLGTPRGRLWQYRNSGRGNAPKPMDPASPNNADACGCQGRNNYDDLSQVWWRFLTGE